MCNSGGPWCLLGFNFLSGFLSLRSPVWTEEGSSEGVLGGSQRRQSTVLSHSSSESTRLTLGKSVDATEFLKGEMWARSKMPSSSTSMMGMSRLQKESVRTEKRIQKRKKSIQLQTDLKNNIRDARSTLIVRWMNSWPKIKTLKRFIQMRSFLIYSN